MLRDVLTILAENAREISYFDKVYTIVERVRKKEANGFLKIFPSEYAGSGQGRQIEYDKTPAMAYFRKSGVISFRELEEPQFTSCDNGVKYLVTIPVKMVCFIPKERADCDDGFVEDEFAENIISKLTTSNLSPENLAKLKSVAVICTGYDTDSISVLEKEYSNAKDINDINYKNAYFSIDFNIMVKVDNVCLNECLTNYNYNG